MLLFFAAAAYYYYVAQRCRHAIDAAIELRFRSIRQIFAVSHACC